MTEFSHGVEPVRQPRPPISKGGDCFACSVLAILRHLFPEREVTLEFVHKVFESEYTTGGTYYQNTWDGYDHALHRLSSGYFHDDKRFEKFDIEYRRFYPVFNMEHLRLHNPHWNNPGGYTDWGWMVDAFLRAGYLLLVEMNSDGEGPVRTVDGKPHPNFIDHVAVVEGVRRRLVRVSKEARKYIQEFHLVDSNKRHKTNEYWIDVDDLLFLHGVAGFWMIRRAIPVQEEDE